jgi:hypothetical protein
MSYQQGYGQPTQGNPLYGQPAPYSQQVVVGMKIWCFEHFR